MWIVALALRRPYTFIVMALLILLLTPITVLMMPTDIFPEIDIPVVSVVWFYTGMAPQDMADRIVTNSERGITTTVNNIEHMESQSVSRPGSHQDILPSRHQHPDGDCAGHGHLANHRAQPAAGHHAAADHLLQRLHHADHSARAEQQNAAGAATVRSRPEFSAHPAGHGAGRGHALSLRRKDPPDPGRSGHAEAAVLQTFADRYRQRPQCAESDSSHRNHQTRRARIQRGDERHAGNHRRVERSAGEDQSTAPRSTCATWPISATALRRRPTSCARTAIAAR